MTQLRPGTAAAEGRVRLAAEHVRLAYDHRVVVRDLDLQLTDGSFTAIVGPNGCGKATLLRALGRLMRPTAGQVLLDGRAIARTPTREVARVLGLLPQAPIAPEGLTVGDLVARGRHGIPTRRGCGSGRATTRPSSPRPSPGPAWPGSRSGRWTSCRAGSGSARGSRWRWRRAPICCCSTNPRPTSTSRTRSTSWSWSAGCTPNAVAPWSWSCTTSISRRGTQRLVAMRDGELVASGTPAEVLTEQLLADVFDLEARILPDPVSSTPMVVPVRRLR